MRAARRLLAVGVARRSLRLPRPFSSTADDHGGEKKSKEPSFEHLHQPPTSRSELPEDAIYDLFKVPDREEASIARLLAVLDSQGLRETDVRLRPMMEKIGQYEHKMEGDCMDVKRFRLPRYIFKDCIHPCVDLIRRALHHELVIPEWSDFTETITEIFDECRWNNDGKLPTYIPQLARQDRNKWGASICTTDGQRLNLGDSSAPFCFQSVSKAFNYTIVSSDLGPNYVHKYVGYEPSGRIFNDIVLGGDQMPHNPMVNSGALVVTALIKTGFPMADRYDFVFNEYKKFAADEFIGFNNSVFLSERESASRNFALAFYLKEYNCFPPGINPSMRRELEFYFQLCSLEANTESASVMAATLANGGINPLTGHRCIEPQACRDVLSLMYSCGMYDGSGQFSFKVGLPAKSGVSGAMIVVVPNTLGLALFSPPLDRMGNPCKGAAFCQKMVDTFTFHQLDSLLHADSQKIDPRRPIGHTTHDH